MNIHATATVDKRAELAENVIVGPGAVIECDARIGPGGVIGPNAVIRPFVRLGPECEVHPGAVIGGVPQDLSFKECRSYVEIGARCILREGVTVHRGTEEDSATVVGAGCFLMANSHVGHNCKVGNQVIMANGALLAGRVELGERVFMSGNSAVHQFVKVGRLAMFAGMSGATKDVPPFCTLHGNLTNRASGLNTIGMRRAGIPAEERNDIKRVFRMICNSDLNVSQALEALDSDDSITSSAREFIDFVKKSTRGICRVRS